MEYRRAVALSRLSEPLLDILDLRALGLSGGIAPQFECLYTYDRLVYQSDRLYHSILT